jgi:hypothetical protein
MKRPLSIICALVGCAEFEDPTIILDLRVIAMNATPPEQVVDIDPANPQLADIVDQLQPSVVCATVADPRRVSSLRWSMTACLTDNGRCDPERPSLELERGIVDDPDVSGAPICAGVVPSSSLVALLVDALTEDTFGGLAGLTYTVELRVGGVDDPPEADQFAAKDLHVFARFPEDRSANRNPELDQIQLQFANVVNIPPLGPCGFHVPFTTGSRTEIAIVPVERGDTRERYPVLTVDGSFEEFDESITYQYLTTAGSLDSQFTGGPRDILGNMPGLSNDWIAPEVERTTDVQLWINQRDERGGTAVYPLCIRVTP